MEAAKPDSVDALGVTRVAHKTPLAFNSDSYNDKSILGFFSVQIENSIVTHDTDSLALVATAGLGPTNIALNMAWDCANTIKTISKSVFFFFAARVMEKHQAYVMGIHGKTIYWECYLRGF